MASKSLPRHVLITGVPGIGKTTLLKEFVDWLARDGTPHTGFYTEEVRSGSVGRGRGGVPKGGPRIGFDVVAVNGSRGPLARVRDEHQQLQEQKCYSVGRYCVDVKSFESVAIPTLDLEKLKSESKPANNQVVVVVDEIGKMELFSRTFIDQVKRLFERDDVIVVATIPVRKSKELKLVEDLRTRIDVHIIEMTLQNRSRCLKELTEMLKTILRSQQNKS